MRALSLCILYFTSYVSKGSHCFCKIILVLNNTVSAFYYDLHVHAICMVNNKSELCGEVWIGSGDAEVETNHNAIRLSEVNRFAFTCD